MLAYKKICFDSQISSKATRVTKLIKRVKDYSYTERVEKLGLTTLLKIRMRDNLNETFKIINEISNSNNRYSVTFLPKLEIYCQGRFQKLSVLNNWT